MACVLTADDVKRSKPDPQGYLISKERANAHWRERGVAAAGVFHVAIEDSPAGVQAALDADLHCIQYLLPNHHPARTQSAQHYCSVSTSFELAAALALRG